MAHLVGYNDMAPLVPPVTLLEIESALAMSRVLAVFAHVRLLTSCRRTLHIPTKRQLAQARRSRPGIGLFKDLEWRPP